MKKVNAQELYDKFGYVAYESQNVYAHGDVVEVADSGALDLELGTKLVVDRELTKAEILDLLKWFGNKGRQSRAHVYGCIAE